MYMYMYSTCMYICTYYMYKYHMYLLHWLLLPVPSGSSYMHHRELP